jgi:hypothetical protein
MLITLEMSPEDAESLMKAFKEGKLAELGIIDVMPAEPEIHSSQDTNWSKSENERRQAPPSEQDEVPPR